jgi:hypothetical protein
MSKINIYIYIGGCGVGWSSWKKVRRQQKKLYKSIYFEKIIFIFKIFVVLKFITLK